MIVRKTIMNIDVKISCIKREIKRRKKFYSELVKNGKMEKDYAAIEIATMQSVLETLTQLKGIIDG